MQHCLISYYYFHVECFVPRLLTTKPLRKIHSQTCLGESAVTRRDILSVRLTQGYKIFDRYSVVSFFLS
jgi:hypothetical protein